MDLVGILQEAFEQCGLDFRTANDWVTGRRSLDLLMVEWANRGVNLWAVEAVTATLTPGLASLTLGSDTVDVLDGAIRTYDGNATMQTDIVITRCGWSDYLSIPNKLYTGEPVQFFVQRGATAPTVYFWPVPDSATTYKFHYYRLRRVQDSGSNPTNTMDVPYRFLSALTSGLAEKIAIKKAPDRFPLLEMQAMKRWNEAQTEDRERADLRIVPDLSGYQI